MDGHDASDVELLGRVAEGDRLAFRELYDRHAPWLAVRLGRRCADQGVVDEVVQDTFVAVWRGAARHRREGEVAAWIWGIGIRRLIDRLRRQPARQHELAAAAATGGTAGTVPSAEEHVLLGIEHGDLGRALGRLSPELRAVVQACVLDGLTTREAARLLAIPTGTVKTRMLRARSRSPPRRAMSPPRGRGAAAPSGALRAIDSSARPRLLAGLRPAPPSAAISA